MSFRCSRAVASVAALAIVGMMAAPAMARPGPWPYPPRHHHHHDSGVDGGDLLAGLLVVGGVAAIASAVSHSQADKAQAQDQAGAPVQEQEEVQDEAAAPAETHTYPGGPEEGRDYSEEGDDRPVYTEPEQQQDDGYQGEEPAGQAYDDSARGSDAQSSSFDAAVDACSGELSGSAKHIQAVDGVRRTGDVFSVEGTLEDGRGFSCRVDEAGKIRSLSVDGRGMI